MQLLSVQAAEMNLEEGSSLIPPSQGLLAATDNGHNSSALLPADDHPQSEPAAQIWGIKFLNLHAANPETHSGSKWAENKKTRHSIPKRQLSLISLPALTQTRIEKSERTREQEFPVLPPVTPAHTPAPVHGLRLLRCTPGPQGNIMLPKVAPAPSPRPCALIAAPIQGVPMLKLLHIGSGAKMARNT